MTHKELLNTIKQLPMKQRIELLEALSRSLEEERAPAERTESQDPQPGTVRLSQRLYGLLKFDGEPPTDKEVGEIRADYLLEKYS